MNDQWSRVDDYIVERLVPSDPGLDHALAANEAANLPAMDVAPNQGKLLYLLAKMIAAKRILEIGTLGGYSSIWLARALGDRGKLVTLEVDPAHAKVARANIEAAGLSARVDLRLGPAIDTLPTLRSLAPFDFIFIDADKPSNPDYLRWALELSQPGTVLVFDNVVRGGAVADAGSRDANVKGVRRLFDMIADEPRLSATALQTVGSKGWDGFAIALVS